jgi:uncharacterized repeat protein (TIGR02543 family)
MKKGDNRMRFLRGIALTLFLLLFCAVLFGCKGKATDNEISMRVSDNYIQWRIGESGDWNNLISLEELQGSDGLGIDSISINAESELVIKFTDGTERNLGNIKGSAGTDGVGLQSVSINENGELIITLSNNQQVNAGKVVGTDGKDGREVELRVDEARNYIQWRYKDEETWYDLISLEALTGEQGNAGLNGLSAYEIYKQYYPDYEKTEEEWIDDLVNGRLATVEKVKLTFELNGGQGISEMEVVKGRTVDLPLPSRCGYRFLGWYSGDGVFDGKFTHFLPVVKDLTLYAKWELIILEGIEIADGDLELPQDSVHQLTVVEKPSNALLPDLVWSSSAPEVVSVDENGLLTAHELGQAVITVKSADEAFSDSIVVTVIDDVDPEFKGVEPEPGLIIVRDGDKFKLKIRASDKNLFELEIDHSLEATLPEFSVYASEDLPYGSLEAKARFEAYGVTVDYDAESQTWEIDFGENVTTFVSAKKVKFYIVLRDKSGNQWGTMYGTTPENTFEYEFISYADYALQALLVAETYEEMREALLTYQDVLSVPADAWEAFHQLPENGVRQQAAIGVLLAAVAQGKVAGLDAVSYYFQLGLREELCKHDFVEGINAVENETEMIEAFLMMIPEFDVIHNLLVAEDIIPGLDETNYTTAIKDLNAFITAGDTDKISKVAAKLLEERGRQPGGEFADEIVLTDVLRGIIDFDLDDPEFKGVEPAPGTIVIKDEGFKWIVKAYDEHLYELEIDHSLEATLPEFSVYANAENPYGTDEDREKFEQYGVIVTYDEETQTWTIDFGMAVTIKFIQAGTVTFYIVLKDVNGYAWGSMFDVTPENTFIYKFEDYYVNALAAILAADTFAEMDAAMREYKDAIAVEADVWAACNALAPARQEEAMTYMIDAIAEGLISDLEGVAQEFTFVVLKTAAKAAFVEAVNGAADASAMLQVFKDHVRNLDSLRKALIAKNVYDLASDDYTVVLSRLVEIMDDEDEYRLAKIAVRLLSARGAAGFKDEEEIASVLKPILESDLDDPEFLGVEPEPGLVFVKESFRWIIKARDENLYELEIDHNINDLPEFSVYASEANPYGTDELREAFASYGVTVTFNSETQTWTIDFGESASRKFIEAGTVIFYIVLKDTNGNTWGSMFDVNPENTIEYQMIDYYAYALEQILAAENAEELAQKIIEYKDACQLDETMVSYYNILPAEKKLAVDSILWAHKISGFYLQTLADVRYYFEHYVSIAAAGLD